ncbi:MAG: hypothetical protein WBW56_04060 [Syntrophobacteraceae bacterium]
MSFTTGCNLETTAPAHIFADSLLQVKSYHFLYEILKGDLSRPTQFCMCFAWVTQ